MSESGNSNNDKPDGYIPLSGRGRKPPEREPIIRRRNEFKMDTVDKVLPGVVTNLGLEKRLREHTLMQVWETLIPATLAQRCRPLFIDHQHNIVIAVSDASVAQELSLMKSKLLQSLAATARSLNLQISGMRIDMKNFHRAKEPVQEPEEALPQPTDIELTALNLSTYDIQLIGELSKKLSSDPYIKGEYIEKAMRAFEQQLRLIQWRRANGYPCCQLCGNPVIRLHNSGSYKICFTCTLTTEQPHK